jgi:type III pantothenate kinase
MLLCVDVGNTQIALGVYDEGLETVVRPPLVCDWRMRTDRRMTADELDVALRSLLGSYQPTGIAALSTVPSLLRELRMLLDRRPELPHVVVGPGVRTGVPLLVDNPREVGADRVVNTLAAHRLYGTACVVVDFGTSTNIDVVSAKGEFLGGVLAPGIEVSLEALANRAAALSAVEIVRPRSVIGKNTVECLQSGVLYGFAGQVDGLVRRILAELGPKAGSVTVIGTGGLAPLMTEVSETIGEYVPDLTLLGLRLAYLRNEPGQSRPARSTVVPSGRSNSPADVSGRPSR